LSKILESRIEMVKLAKQWRYWAKRIAEGAKEILGECKVYVFGSVAEGQATGGSDVDILIVSDRIPDRSRDRWELRAAIEEKAGLPLYHPYEIHLANTREAEWYFRFIKTKIVVE